MLRYLAVLAVLAVMLVCFTGDVSAVSDQEFQELQNMMRDHTSQLKEENQRQSLDISHLMSEISHQKDEISQLKDQNKLLFSLVNQLQDTMKTNKGQFEPDSRAEKGSIMNTTIEEKVTTLEVQMMDVQEDIAEINEDVSLLFEDVNFLFDEQVIQDERILTLEQDADQIEDDVESLQVTALELDFRVTELEENGGSDGNSSISELEVRVETLEGTAADHETRITSAEGDVEDLEGSRADHETRITAAEENIQGLQMTDINHDARISALEENGGGGGSENETIAFHAVLTSYDTIPVGATVEFNEVVLNQGNGYVNSTGLFMVPPGGDGLYYFSTYLLVFHGELANFDIQLNGDVICTAYGDHSDNGSGDYAQTTCSAAVSVVEGDEVKVVLRGATDDTPLAQGTARYYCGFNGFRI